MFFFEEKRDIDQAIRPGCSLDEEQFVIAGRGGLPSHPLGLVNGDRPWLDFRNPFALNNSEITDLAPVEYPPDPASIQEAIGMAIASDGNLQLVTDHSQNVAISYASCSSQATIL